jgi:alpha-beta hydrolase superfamily lysophospholipase
MGQPSATLDQSVIATLQSKLPPFSAEMPWVDHSNSALLQYLDFYQLPIPLASLKLRAGTLTLRQQTLTTMAWEPEHAVGSVIVVHGYMDHTGLFNHLIKHLLEHRLNVICFDLPGHGLSTGQPGFILDYADYVSALNAVIQVSQTMYPQPLHGIGQSMGGAILLKHLLGSGNKKSYPFASLNLFAPLLQPAGWPLKRLLYQLTKGFRKSVKRVFRPSSFDKEFLAFVRDRDPFQPRAVPTAWVGALDSWVKEFKQCDGSDFPINLIQGSGDKTLDWAYNLNLFKKKLSGLDVQIIADANHHMVNEIEPMRRDIFAALQLPPTDPSN